MTRQEFEEALIPLTPKEKAFELNPNINFEIYHNLLNHKNYNDPDFRNLIKNRIFLSDSNILPERTDIKNYKSQDIAFNRNERFINIPLHNHYGFIEMNYVFSGNATAIINDKIITLSKGDFCIMDCNVVHTLLPTGRNDIVLNILLSSEYFSNSFLNLNGGPVAKFLADIMTENNAHNQHLLLHTFSSPLVKELIENMIIEYLDPGIFCKEVLYYNINLLFIELARCYQYHLEKDVQKKKKNNLADILSYIESHCISCSLEDVAKQFHFNPKYLSRMLKSETGSNFQDILFEYRMNRAGFLLSNSDIPIYKVANDCGYQNQSFFRQKFMKHFNMAPAEYRANTQIKKDYSNLIF